MKSQGRIPLSTQRNNCQVLVIKRAQEKVEEDVFKKLQDTK